MAKLLRSKDAKIQVKRSHPGDQKWAIFVSNFLSVFSSFHTFYCTIKYWRSYAKKISLFFSGSDIINTSKPKRVGKFTVHWNWCVFLVPGKSRKECSFLFNLKSHLNSIPSVVQQRVESKTLHPNFKRTVKNQNIPTVRSPDCTAD